MYTNGYNSIPVMAGLKKQRKKIKKSKKIKELDSFDYLAVFALFDQPTFGTMDAPVPELKK